MPFWFVLAADIIPMGLMVFNVYEFVTVFVCVCDEKDADKYFHSHNVYIPIELAVQTLTWYLGPFISVLSIGFGTLIKMIKISHSINMQSNYSNSLNTAIVWSFPVSREA